MSSPQCNSPPPLWRRSSMSGGGTRVYANIHRVGATASAGLRSATRRRLASVGAGWRADLGQDLFDVAGEVTTAGSRVLADAPAAEKHAAVVERLLQAGAVVVGKTTMTEFAYSGLGINPHYGTPANLGSARRRVFPAAPLPVRRWRWPTACAWARLAAIPAGRYVFPPRCAG